MSRGRRLALIAAGIAVAVVLFIVARPEDDDDSNESRSQTTTQPAETQRGTPSAAPQPPHAEPEAERIEVRGGKVQGGIKEIEVENGDVVQFLVTADVADRVHVHGYDLFKDVEPGRPARFNFEADNEGIFEIELEDTHTPIAELTVTP